MAAPVAEIIGRGEAQHGHQAGRIGHDRHQRRPVPLDRRDQRERDAADMPTTRPTIWTVRSASNSPGLKSWIAPVADDLSDTARPGRRLLPATWKTSWVSGPRQPAISGAEPWRRHDAPTLPCHAPVGVGRDEASFAKDGGDFLGRSRTAEVVALALDAAFGEEQARPARRSRRPRRWSSSRGSGRARSPSGRWSSSGRPRRVPARTTCRS